MVLPSQVPKKNSAIRSTATLATTPGRSPNDGSTGSARGGRGVRGADWRDSGQVVHVAVLVLGPKSGPDHVAARRSASYRNRRVGSDRIRHASLMRRIR